MRFNPLLQLSLNSPLQKMEVNKKFKIQILIYKMLFVPPPTDFLFPHTNCVNTIQSLGCLHIYLLNHCTGTRWVGNYIISPSNKTVVMLHKIMATQYADRAQCCRQQ
jgi:hypothetical protein